VRLDKKELVFFADPASLHAEAVAESSLGKFSQRHDNLFFEQGVSVATQFVGEGKAFWGAHSYAGAGGYLRGEVFIGRYCSIGRRVSIGAGMHSMTGLSSSPELRGIRSRGYSTDELALVRSVRKRSGVVLESDVWIGDGAVITPGVRIGVGSVIAANAVVSKDVRPYSIVGGVPAKEIGTRFDDSVIDRLVRSQWWEIAYETLNSMPLANVFQFLDVLLQQRSSAHEFTTYRLS
jgi:virginiamycin A acetyltransferase